MKKSAIAIAVTGAIGFPAAAAADASVYGRVDIGLETTTDPTADFVFPGFNSVQGQPNEGETGFELQNGNQSRIGFTGSEDLGGGWEASTTIELEADVLDDDGLGAGTRLGWVQLANGPHSLTVGKQWQPYYEYSGWNVGKLPTHGHAYHFKMASYMLDAGVTDGAGGASGNDATGYRQTSSIGYQFGGGGYSKDPFTLDVLLGINNGGETVNDGAENEAGISSIQVFAQSTFGPDITINGGVIQDFRDLAEDNSIPSNSNTTTVEEVEPSLVTVGGRFPIADSGFSIGANYALVQTDQPQGDDEVEGFKITGFWSGPNGWSAELGWALVDADKDTARFSTASLSNGRVLGSSFEGTGALQTEVDTIHFGVTKNLSSRTSLRFVGEFSDVSEATPGSSGISEDELEQDGGVLMLGMQHNF